MNIKYCYVIVIFCVTTYQSVLSMQPLIIKSSAFSNNTAIPTKYTGEGQNISPELHWSNIPADTKSLVLIVDDPDAPNRKNPNPKAWVHWVIYDLPSNLKSLPEEAKINELGGKEGTNNSHNKKYDGPMPPPGSGPHRYFFKLYALDTILNLKPGSTKDAIEKAMQGHIIAQDELIGTYERK